MISVFLLASICGLAFAVPPPAASCSSPGTGSCNSFDFSHSYHYTDDMKAQGKGRRAMHTLMDLKERTIQERLRCEEEGRCNRPQSITGALVPCVDGMAGEYPCDNVDLLSFLSFDDLGWAGVSGLSGNDIWVWHDLQEGDDYVIMGFTHGSSFVRVTDPVNPFTVGILETHTTPSSWRDMKVVGDFAFIVSEASGHGMQIFDLTRLRGVEAFTEFTSDAHYDLVGNTHNIVANPENNRVFLVGSTVGPEPEICSGGLHIVDVAEPLSPQFLGCYGGDGYTHDAQCIIYEGPDSRYNGQEICFSYNEDTFTIVDTTDPENVVLLSREGYEKNAYSHQGWNTEDNTYALLDDELDELVSADKRTTTFVWDINDLTAPVLVNTHFHEVESSDHNMYIKGDYAHQSNYMSGYRLISLSNLPELTQAAFFDCFPSSTSAGFDGTWSNYPYFDDGHVAVSSIDRGLYMVKPNFAAIEAPKK